MLALSVADAFEGVPFAPVLAAVLAVFVCAAAIKFVRRTDVLADLPPGYDWSNSPDGEHPGGNLCPCPRHTMHREHPGVWHLCGDCRRTIYYSDGPDGAFLRLVWWIYGHVVLGRLIFLRHAATPDDCHECNRYRDDESGGRRDKPVHPAV